MGMMVIHGAQGGGFSPISVYGVTVNTIVEDEGLPNSALAVFLASLFFNLVIALVLFFVLGGRKLIGRKVDARRGGRRPASGGDLGHRGARATARRRGDRTSTTHPDRPQKVTVEQILTLIGLAVVAVLALVFDQDIGFVSITVAVVLAMFSAEKQKGAVSQISWPTVLLVAGRQHLRLVLQEAGTTEYVGKWAAGARRGR